VPGNTTGIPGIPGILEYLGIPGIPGIHTVANTQANTQVKTFMTESRAHKTSEGPKVRVMWIYIPIGKFPTQNSIFATLSKNFTEFAKNRDFAESSVSMPKHTQRMTLSLF
jgi:hypothetical protein